MPVGACQTSGAFTPSTGFDGGTGVCAGRGHASQTLAEIELSDSQITATALMSHPSHIIRYQMLLRLFLAWVLGTTLVFIGLTGIELPQRFRYSALIANEAMAPGIVTKCEPGNHNTFAAIFSLGPSRYESGGFIEDIGECYVGRQVTVDYQTDNPSNSCVCDPNFQLADTWQFPTNAALLLGPTGLIIYWAISFRRGRRLDPDADESREVTSFSGEPIISPRRSWSRSGLPGWLWSSGPVLYELPLEPSEVTKRLAVAVESESPLESGRRGAALSGSIQGRRFHVGTTGSRGFRAWLESTLDGTISAAPGGSLVIAKFSLRGLLLAWGTTCLAFAAVIAASTIAAVITRTPPQASLFIIVPLIASVALFVGGRLAGVRGEEALLAELDQLFGVTPGK